ncbi:Hypothetical protein NCS54_01094000 [Fusarium falciforme]|uniref:Hypothetical protein n=1 Tax=Fusarium falciforme TaxID=195108 RepID=UPI0023005380|nr:Hypothetical protein NCS54_01094000 [Fusarium falciforme]WAO93393.1 Hypothetical protein NCS54_01094000 [Fusarium falciforme]
MGSLPDTLLVADLKALTGAISFHDLESCTQQGTSIISGFHYTRHEPSRPHDGEGHPKYAKAVIRGSQVARKAAEIFNDLGQGGAASITITSSGLVGGPPCEGHALNVEGITFFVKTVFHFPSSLGKTGDKVSTQYLHFSSPTTQIVPQGLSDKRDKFGLQDLTIVSGVCLFSMKTILSSISKAQRIHVKKLQAGPALYEMEYIARSAPVIADLAALLGANVRRKTHDDDLVVAHQGLNLRLDVPSFHYYQSVDDCLQSGSCTFQEALEWLNAVKKRHEQISHVFRGYINYELSKRCSSAEALNIKVSPGADLVCSIIRHSLEMEPAWASFYRLVPEKERPHDFRSLGYLFYVFQVVRQALVGNEACGHGHGIPSKNGDKPARLLISVDDGIERRVYSRAQKILKKMRASSEYPVPSTLLEVYLCRRVFIDGNEKGSNLYLDDPSPEPMGNTVNKSVYRTVDGYSDTFQCPHSKSLGMKSLAVVEKLYGVDTAAVLRQLCAEAGLCP